MTFAVVSGYSSVCTLLTFIECKTNNRKLTLHHILAFTTSARGKSPIVVVPSLPTGRETFRFTTIIVQ